MINKILLFCLLILSISKYDVKSQTIESKLDYSKIYAYCLDADIKSALPLINQYRTDELSNIDIIFKNEFDARFSFRTDESMYLENRNSPVDELLKVYRDYWRISLLDPSTNYSNVIKKDVSRILSKKYHLKPEANDILDEDTLYVYLKKYVQQFGLSTTGFVKTGKLYDFLVWQDESDTVYNFSISNELINVRVVFLDNFITLGWEEYATLDKYYPGGWMSPDAIFCVRKGYNLNSESFLISYLCHEGRHFTDRKLFPKLNSVDMEYRAKLTELTMLNEKLYKTLEKFIVNSNEQSQNAHSVANFFVVRDLSRSLFESEFESDIEKWKQISVEEINNTSNKIFNLNTRKLQELGTDVERSLD